MSDKKSEYKREMDKLRSIELVAVLKAAPDAIARNLVDTFTGSLSFDDVSRHNLMIEQEAWKYVMSKDYSPVQVFCHPDLLIVHPLTSLYYRGMTGLSRKAVGQLAKPIDKAERDEGYKFKNQESPLAICRLYNLFMSSIILGSEGWALENGYRTILATMGITFDGSSRNRVGDVAEQRIRTILLEYITQADLSSDDDPIGDPSVFRSEYRLKDGYKMKFSDEPDVYFTDRNGSAVCTIEIKGGLDPAGALERLGAAQKSFLHAIKATATCNTYLVAGVITKTMEERLRGDRNFTKFFAMVDIITDAGLRETFLHEVFHYGLRLVK